MAKVSEIYGSMVFNEHTMQERLPSATYKSLIKTMKEGKPLEIEVANVVAHAMKEWAIEKGATHFTHWFQPLTGITSEKHDSFLDPCSDGRAIMSFSGKELIQGEPDASSFPSGGLRATFEARGYTAWDPTSYAFIKDEVLCIPTAFCSYTGEALDKKTPLLRSMSAVEEQANRVLALFGEPRQRIVPTLGAEQEYFLVSEKAYAKRQDLIMTGRTLFGYAPCKGQELDEHYFGAIRPTVNEFMKELDNELWALGVPARTKHNEVAPAQHELAPIFTNVNRGVDENLLTMEKMRLLASHHGLVCLQHEKPFEGINGSGKHNNWSLSAGKKNLFDPGESPMDNLRFLVFLAGVIQAVDDYQELLRMSVASAGNDHRLGADEAPPAIISIFLGDELDAIVDALIDDHEYTNAEKVAMDLGVAVLPNFPRTTPTATAPRRSRSPATSSSSACPRACTVDCNMIRTRPWRRASRTSPTGWRAQAGEEFEAAAIDYIRDVLTGTSAHLQRQRLSEEWSGRQAPRGWATLLDARPRPACFRRTEAHRAVRGVRRAHRNRVRPLRGERGEIQQAAELEARTMKRMVRRAPAPHQPLRRRGGGHINAIRRLARCRHRQQEELLRRLCWAQGDRHDVRALGSCTMRRWRSRARRSQANTYAHEVIPVMDRMRTPSRAPTVRVVLAFTGPYPVQRHR